MLCEPASRQCIVVSAGFVRRFQINYDIKCVQCDAEREIDGETRNKLYQNKIDIVI